MRSYIAFAFLVLGSAQAADLPIGSVSLELGTPQAAVIAEVNARFRVIPVSGNPDMYFLAERHVADGKVIGGIAFKNGRLQWIQRNWANLDGAARADEAAKAMFLAIQSATSSTGSAATVSTEIKTIPGAEFRSTHFRFSGREVTITVTDGDAAHGGNQVTVDESVSI